MLAGPAAEAAAAAATVAVFYSISSTQRGLAGVDLGNYLIKQAAVAVQRNFPGVHRLVTLSPIPGFRPWLDMRIKQALQVWHAAEDSPGLTYDLLTHICFAKYQRTSDMFVADERMIGQPKKLC